MIDPLEILREYKRFYRFAFPKLLAAAAKKYRERESEKSRALRLARQRRYDLSPAGKASSSRADQKRYYSAEGWAERQTPEYKTARTIRKARRRAKKAGQSTQRLGDSIRIAKIYARARGLRRWFDVVVDHIIPLAKGGPHAPDNLQIIYAHENVRKGMKLDYIPKVVFV